MPYLNVQNFDEWQHLCQLFFAANPEARAVNDELRAQAETPGQYFFSAERVRQLAFWAIKQHLITRKTYQRLLASARYVAAPDAVITIRQAVLGEPPRLQPALLASELYSWMAGSDTTPQPGENDYLLRWPVAIQIVQSTIEHDPDLAERAAILLAWLEEHQPPDEA